MRILFTLFLSLIFYACHKENNRSREAEQIWNRITLVEQSDAQAKFARAKYITTAAYSPLYIGTQADTVLADHLFDFREYQVDDWSNYSQPDSASLRIFVDTSQCISHADRVPPPPRVAKEDSLNVYEAPRYFAYPVYLINQSTDTLDIGYGEYIPLILEAKDSTEAWRPIQRPRILCGTGLRYILLPPDNLVLTAYKLYKGKEQTKLRLRLGDEDKVYSNEFTGNINYSQFIDKGYGDEE
ncbi:hypothetical protein AB9P05_04365 [Roseivirga sp. BDSF3-8]|uniref:hypothetical protein n=1 Tax=Roseivirga sp. BDSF3-8 TaxID=3241598 RepID=UPI0035320C97